jgi:poly-gamma-glutamate synthesis protein (capsule biosynthesis protein)
LVVDRPDQIGNVGRCWERVDASRPFEYHAWVMKIARGSRDFRRRAARRRRSAALVVLCSLFGLLLALTHGCWNRGTSTDATAATTRPPPPPPPETIHIAAVGDVMLDRGVWRQIEANGVHHVMREVRDRLRSADLTFANLECPLSTVQGHARPGGDLIFCADPETVQVLLDGGVDVVAMANNHGLDAGTQGAEDTMQVLEDNCIAYAGGRPDEMEPDEITYLRVGNTILAFLAYTDLDVWHESMCKVDDDMQNALARVREAASNADLVCVSYHWGVEYQKQPTDRQVELAHATIDAGADIILGHHPHVMSGVEAYQDGVILYSMGNFVFDQRDRPDGRMNTAIFNLYVTPGERIDMAIVPLYIPRPEFAPRLASEERGSEILAELAELCAELGTDLQIEGQKAKATFAPSTATSRVTAGPTAPPG